MARLRLVMLGVIHAGISPSQRAQGRESEVRVEGLGEGEELELLVHGGDPKIVPLFEGKNSLSEPLPAGRMFQVRKGVGGMSPTTVEVFCG